MATIPTFRTWTAGEIVTAAYMNSNVRDAGNFSLAKPYCELTSQTAQALTTATALLINFDSENEDNDSMHDPGNPSRVVFNTRGVYSLHYYCRLGQPTSGSFSSPISLNLRLNSGGSSSGGSSLSTTAYNNTSGTSTQAERMLRYRVQNIGDYYEVFVTASFTGTLSYSSGSRVTGTSAEFIIA